MEGFSSNAEIRLLFVSGMPGTLVSILTHIEPIFEWRYAEDSSRTGFTLWTLFDASSHDLEPSEKDFMITYRVQHLASLVEELK